MDVLKRLNLPEFKPLPCLAGSWRQTVFGSYWPQRRGLRPDVFHEITLKDGDRLLIAENRPATAIKPKRLVLMVHGLAGSHESPYMRRISRKLVERGHLVWRINLRGCGPGISLATGPYHSGRSEDTREVVAFAGRMYPHLPVTQLGFSLGANITLKMLGEDGSTPVGNLDSGIAISAPIDLASCTDRLQQNPRHRFFDKFFVWKLRHDLAELKRHHHELKDYEFPLSIRLTDVDELYTAPRGGFADAQDYYAKSSSLPLIRNIAVPTLILHAKDDPVVAPEPYGCIPPNPYLDTIITEAGGHVAFLGRTGKGLRNVRWMDEVIVRWINERADH